MKILFLSHAQYITVALPKIIEQAEICAGKGHDVTLVATSKKNVLKVETFTKNGVRYVISPSILPGKYRHGADVYDALRRGRYLAKYFDFDIMHAIDSRPTVILPALYLRKRKKIPLILEWSDLYSDGGTISERSSKLYGRTFGRIESFFETGFRKYADGATTITNYLKDKLIELGYDERKIYLHRMGCIVDEGKLMSKSNAREEVQLPSSEIIIGHLGKIYRKDQKLLIDAFELLRQSHDNVRLVFVGYVDKKIAAGHPAVEYVGYLNGDRFKQYCNAFDFFVLPLHKNKTNTARWPSKIGDYFSYAKPVVSTEVNDLGEIFTRNRLGVLAQDSPEAFAGGMKEMIQMRDSWELLGRNAYRFAQDALDWNIICDKLLHFYENVVYNGAVEK